ncbi:hypothetical protein [uncultured Campylobacter sp.]|uniref:hypothetical protein n=1 Tax=uncultured Campylobacter sp. TaxID=218934 RepID=UPI00260985DB|nr:hypothetical protein [uncultured Campylobacter sp.]
MNYEEFYGAVCEMVEKFEASRAANKELDAYLLALLRLLEARGGEPFSAELMLEILSAAFESEKAELGAAWLEIERAPELADFCKDDPAGGGDTFRSAEEPKTAADIMRCLPEGFEIKFDESRSANLKTAPSEAKFTNGDRENNESRTLEQNYIAVSGSASVKAARGESFGQKTNEPLKFEAADKHGGLAYSAEVIKFHLAELSRMRASGQLADESKFFGIISSGGHGWYNFDPFSLLECGARGLMDHAGEDAPVRGGWEMLGELLEMGRTYE